jgi:hypothetical protein
VLPSPAAVPYQVKPTASVYPVTAQTLLQEQCHGLPMAVCSARTHKSLSGMLAAAGALHGLTQLTGV